MQSINILFPRTIDNTIHGSRWPYFIFLIYTVISTVRSLIHLLAPDGGAGSIAGMNLDVAGRDEIVFAFALWGSSQLLISMIQILACLRYRSIVPFLYLLLITETVLRMLIGHLKTANFEHTPPGAIGNYVILPFSVIMLLICIFTAKDPKRYSTNKLS